MSAQWAPAGREEAFVLEQRRRAVHAVVALAAVGVLIALALRFVIHDGRQDIDLRDWVGDDGSWAQRMMPGARMATDELCDEALPCVQAVTAETLTMYRFTTEDEAATAAREFGGDAYLSHWIVVRFEADRLTPAQRREFGRSLDCVDVGIADDGREC
jgi:hypothetical protein